MADQGKADPAKLAIDGGSAGGFAALAAITYHNVFSAATSFYGISDLVALATETHKFESRYVDTLIGPYPKQEKVYIARSPINRIDLVSSALCIFQGSEDKVGLEIRRSICIYYLGTSIFYLASAYSWELEVPSSIPGGWSICFKL